MSTRTVSIRARDVSGQRAADVPDLPADFTVGEMVKGLLASMKLPENDADGRAVNYHPLLEREGRHLQSQEVVGEVLHENDEIVMQPNIDAGTK